MKIGIVSDLHLEFHMDEGLALANEIGNWDCETLVIAGDLCHYGQFETTFNILCDKFENIIYILGNHEYYNGDLSYVMDKARSTEAKFSNLSLLENQTVNIKGQRFVGCTMWFPWQTDNPLYENMLSDFLVIYKDFTPRVYDMNEASVGFLKHQIHEDDIVITHHMPSENSISPFFKGDQLNRFFLCDVEDLIKQKQPKMWIHGHTHSSFDYKIGNTRVICNPFSYPDSLNAGFHKLIVED